MEDGSLTTTRAKIQYSGKGPHFGGRVTVDGDMDNEKIEGRRMGVLVLCHPREGGTG